MNTSHDDIMLIYKWFCAAMRKAGRKESFPKGTDPKKTYKYRALRKFAENVEEWEFDNSTTKSMINAVVDYGRSHRLLNKGAMILNMKSVLEICLEDLEQKSDAVDGAIIAIDRCRAYLVKVDITSSKILASPERMGGMSRLSALLASGKMPTSYLAVSRMARAALLRIDNKNYPSNRELRRLRARLLYDNISRSQLEVILGDDLDTSGLVGSVTCRT